MEQLTPPSKTMKLIAKKACEDFTNEMFAPLSTTYLVRYQKSAYS